MTPKQEQFVAEYLANGLNATKAAISAGYSEKTAQEQGSRLLSNVMVSAEIARKPQIRTEKLGCTADRVLDMAAKMAFFDVRKLFEADGSPKQIHELDDETAAGIAGFEFLELFEGQGDQKHAFGILKKVKLIDRRASVDMLMRHHSLYNDKLKHEGEVKITRVMVPKRIGTQASKRDVRPEF